MSSKELEKPLVIRLKPSKILLLIVSAVNVLALFVIYTLALDFQYTFFFAFIVCANYAHFLYKYNWVQGYEWIHLLSQPIVKIVYLGDNEWQLQHRNGQTQNANLLGSSFSGLSFVVLKFRVNGARWMLRRLSVVIIQDGIDPVSFRHLRIHLRLTVNPT